MKKFLIALTLGLLLVAAFATVASADNGPHGGTFAANTSACASCHRVHSAKTGWLLISDIYAMCMTCHNGDGAGTNVEDGVYTEAGAVVFYGTGVGGSGGYQGTNGGPLLGGGFVNTLMSTEWTGNYTNNLVAATARPVTSTHDVAGLTTIGGAVSDGMNVAWGSGAPAGLAAAPNFGASMELECTSCHSPHGSAGFTNTVPATSGYTAATLPHKAGLGMACDPQYVPGTVGGGSPFVAPCSTATATYRILRWHPEGSDGYTPPPSPVAYSGGAFPVASNSETGWTVPDVITASNEEWYTVEASGAAYNGLTPFGSFAPADYFAGRGMGPYVTGKLAVGEAPTTVAPIQMAFFCAQCHDRYFNNSSLREPGATTYGPADDAVYMYRHSSGEIRSSMLGGTSGSYYAGSIGRSCIACHVAHGTSAEVAAPFDAADDYVTTPGVVTYGGSLAGGSTLLRWDGRSVCLRCHQGAVAPAGVTAPIP
jgi:predicted CXXCH cytochrome family protein